MLAALLLGLGVTLRGVVIAPEGERPLAGVRVAAAHAEASVLLYSKAELACGIDDASLQPTPDAVVSAVARTDAQGRFELAGLRPGRYHVLAVDTAAGIRLTRTELGADGAELTLRLEPPAFVELELTGIDAADPHYLIEVQAQAAPLNVSLLPFVERTPRGTFRAGPLPSGPEWSVLVTEWVREGAFRATRAREPFTLVPGGTRKLSLDLGRAAQASGRLRTRAGEPLANASVLLRPVDGPPRERGARSDGEGRFVVGDLAPGDYLVEARRWGLRAIPGCGQGPLELEARARVRVEREGPQATGPSGLELVLEPPVRAVAVGEPAPEFEAPTLSGARLSLAGLRGQVVLLDFWATWCVLCRGQLAELRALATKHAGSGRFTLVGVSLDEEPERVRAFAAQRGLAWAQTALGPARTNPLSLAYNVWATPSSVLIDREGRIAALNLSGAELAAAVERLLAK